MKKFFLSFVLLFSVLTGLAQSPTNVQKGGTAGTNNITGDLNIGTGKTWTVASGGTFTIASGATVNTPAGAIPWSAISNTPTSIAGYGILDPLVYTNVSYSNPAWVTALAASKITGVLVSSNMPAYTGDVTSSSGATVNTLATVNVSPGVIGSGTAIPVITVNGKGLTTLVTTATNTPAYANITGLPSTAAGYGITNGAAIDALGAVSSTGLLQRTAANTYSVATYSGLAWNAGVLSVTADAGLPDQSGANAQFLTSNGSAASWSFVPLTTGVSGILPIANGGTGRATGTTAYGLLAAGTTAAGVQQTLPAGATTDLLVGGGASALPAWTTATGSGAPVRATSPTLVTPTLGVATATSINGVGLSGSGSVANTGVTALTAFTGSGTSSGTNTGDQTTISGNAATATALQTARSIYGNNFDGTAALAQIIASTFGGTGNGFTKFSGPATAEKTFTLPNASATILTDNAAVTVAQGGTGRATGTTAYGLIAAGTTATAAQQTLSAGATTDILVGGGASALPAWTTATGSGAPVRATSPALVTPALGVATATSINGNFFTTGSSTYTGTAAQTYTFPTTTAIIARTDAANTFTGTQTFSNAINYGGVLLSAAVTGTGNMVLSASPTFSGTPIMGTALTVSNGFTIGAGSSREPLSVTGSGTDTIFHVINTNTGGTDWQLRSIGPTVGTAPAGSFVFFNSSLKHWMDPSGNVRFGGNETLDGTLTFAGTSTIIAATATNLILQSGSSGAVITVGQGASGIVQINSAGTGAVFNSDINITASNPGLRINDSAGSHYNWYLGGQTNVNNGFEITPSTATGGSTFSTPLFTLTQAAVSTFATTAAIVNVAGTTEATTGGAGSITTAGGIYATKKIVPGGGLLMPVAQSISITSGTNQRAGNTTLVGGTVTVANTTVTANTIVMLTRKTSGGTIGTSITYTTSAATSFTVTSDNILDTSTFSYLLIEVL